jgi:hypothetical protein
MPMRSGLLLLADVAERRSIRIFWCRSNLVAEEKRLDGVTR